MQQIEQDIKDWADRTMPKRTLAGRLRKLGEEFGELAEAVCEASVVSDALSEEWLTWPEADARAAHEAADCAIILSDICSMLGFSLSGLMRVKLDAMTNSTPAADSNEQRYVREKP